MSDDERLNELLLRWEELREHGKAPTPEEMCRDCPDLLAPFRELAGALAGLGLFMGPSTLPSPGPPKGPAPTGPRYRATTLHARGGLGEVYLAEDVELRRQVALKRMQARAAGHPDLRRRFLLEAEVTGRLEHPGVVPVYGLGLGDDGQPYYAMRFVRGETLQEAITGLHQAPEEGRSLLLRQLLGRFVTVCQTVAYAHSRGVIHRDLKPANVLLGPYGETLVVDWGLARPIERTEADRQGGEETLTPTPDIRPDQTRGVVGTPAYMSPEQASGLPSLVGPASDVYSLGATLYHLLTGQAPFGKGSLDELLAKVQRGAFAPPRSRHPGVPRALEAVCLKAMAIEIKDRYPGAGELAADLDRWLADEPVTAWREPLPERVRRWVKRRRTAVMATAAAGTVALVALALSTALLGAANQRERDARAEAEASADRERGERERAERMFQLAERSSGTLLELSEELKGATETQARATGRALSEVNRRYDELRRAGGDRPEVLEGKARVLTSLAEVDITLGDTEAARRHATEALALYQQLRAGRDLTRDRVGVAAAREQLGQALLFQGQLEGGAAAHRQALAIRQALPRGALHLALQARTHNFLGNILRVRGLDRSAEAEYRQALALCRQAVAADPGLTFARGRLAASLEKVGDSRYYREDLAGAARLYQSALGEVAELMRARGSNTALLQHQAQLRLSLGWARLFLGEPAKARPLIEQALADCERFALVDPTNGEWQRLRMQARAYSANLRRGGDPREEAREVVQYFRHALASSRERAARDPRNLEWAAQEANISKLLATGLLALGNLGLDTTKNYDEAEALLASAVKQLQRLHAEVPGHLQFAEALGGAYHDLGLLARVRGQSEESHKLSLKWQSHLQAVYERGRRAGVDVPVWEGRLAGIKRRMTDAFGLLSRDLPAAARSAQEAVALYLKLHQAEPDHAPWLRDLAASHDGARRALMVLAAERSRERHPNDLEAQHRDWLKGPERTLSLRHLHQARDAREGLIRLQPGVVRWHTELADCYRQLADERRLNGDAAGEELYYHKYLDTLEGLARRFPEEASRDPFVDPGPVITGEYLGGQAVKVDTTLLARQISLSEQLYWKSRRPRLGVELAEHYIRLVRGADLKTPAELKQARWAVRRGLGLLREMSVANTLHPVHARMVPFYEAKLRELGGPAEAAALPPDWRRAWLEMDFPTLVRRASKGERLADLIGALDRMAADGADVPWLKLPLRYNLLEALLSSGGMAEAAVAEARKQQATLSRPGRDLFGLLARLLQDRDAAEALTPSAVKGPLPEWLGEVLSLRLRERGRFLASARAFDEAIRSKPGAAAPDLVGVAQSWLDAGRSEEALAALDRATKLAPEGPWARQLRGLALIAGRQFAEARTAIQSLEGVDGLSPQEARDLRALRGWALAEEGQVGQAELVLRSVLKEAPDHTVAGAALAWLLAGQGGRLEEAGKVTASLLKQSPSVPTCRLAAAVVQVASGQAREALPDLEKLAATEPTSFDLHVFQVLGEAYYQLGQGKQAVAAWKKALALFPRTARPDDRRRRAIEIKLREALRPG